MWWGSWRKCNHEIEKTLLITTSFTQKVIQICRAPFLLNRRSTGEWWWWWWCRNWFLAAWWWLCSAGIVSRTNTTRWDYLNLNIFIGPPDNDSMSESSGHLIRDGEYGNVARPKYDRKLGKNKYRHSFSGWRIETETVMGSLFHL